MPSPDIGAAKPPTAFLIWIHLCWSVSGPVCVRVGPLSVCPGAVSAPPPPCSYAGQPNEPTLMGLQPHCSTAHSTPAHTLQERESERGYSASLRQDRELMGHFALYNMVIFQFADLIQRSVILAVTVFTGTGSGRQLIPDRMVYWFLRCGFLVFTLWSLF